MATRVPPAPRPDPRRTKPSNVRLQLQRFQSWQRTSPPPTVALVRLVRLLAR